MTDWLEKYKEDMRIASLTEEEWQKECADKFRKEMPHWVPEFLIRLFLWSVDLKNWKQFVYKFPVVLSIYMLTLVFEVISIPFYIFYAYYLIVKDIYRSMKGHR